MGALAVFLVTVLLAVLVAVVPQSITLLFTRAVLEIRHPLHHLKVITVVLVKVLTEFQKQQAAAVVLALLVKTMQVAFLAMAVLALQVVSAAHLSTMLVAVVVAAIDRVGLLEVLEVVVLEGFTLAM